MSRAAPIRSVEYPCATSDGLRWFRMEAFTLGGEVAVGVRHVEVATRRSDSSVAAFGALVDEPSCLVNSAGLDTAIEDLLDSPFATHVVMLVGQIAARPTGPGAGGTDVDAELVGAAAAVRHRGEGFAGGARFEVVARIGLSRIAVVLSASTELRAQMAVALVTVVRAGGRAGPP